MVTEIIRSQIWEVEMGIEGYLALLWRCRLWSSIIQAGLGAELLHLHIKSSQLRWLKHLIRLPPGRLLCEGFEYVQPE